MAKGLDGLLPVPSLPLAVDDEIADRLTKILTATTWFENLQEKVDEGVVFFERNGRAGRLPNVGW